MKNEALARLEPLIGAWDLTMSNAWFLDSLDEKASGHASFEWLDDIFVVFRFAIGEPPPAVCVIGYSDSRGEYQMLYHDDRGVARVFEMEFTGSRMSLLREDSDFHQRFGANVSDDRIEGWWEASEDEGNTGERTSTSCSNGWKTPARGLLVRMREPAPGWSRTSPRAR